MTSNGQGRRLRFSDLPAESSSSGGGGGGYGPATTFGGNNARSRVMTELGGEGELGPVYNAWNDGDQRYPARVVGQAL